MIQLVPDVAAAAAIVLSCAAYEADIDFLLPDGQQEDKAAKVAHLMWAQHCRRRTDARVVASCIERLGGLDATDGAYQGYDRVAA